MGHRVYFRTADRIAEAIDGETLLDTARRSGVHLDSSCGGNGSCHQCRVALPVCRDHDVSGDPANFHDGAGSSLAPQHSRNGQPIWLACRGFARGELVVDAAPVNALADRPRVQTLEGWEVAPATGPARVCAGTPCAVLATRCMPMGASRAQCPTPCTQCLRRMAPGPFVSAPTSRPPLRWRWVFHTWELNPAWFLMFPALRLSLLMASLHHRQ